MRPGVVFIAEEVDATFEGPEPDDGEQSPWPEGGIEPTVRRRTPDEAWKDRMDADGFGPTRHPPLSTRISASRH